MEWSKCSTLEGPWLQPNYIFGISATPFLGEEVDEPQNYKGSEKLSIFKFCGSPPD